jgi:hypothetical protein
MNLIYLPQWRHDQGNSDVWDNALIVQNTLFYCGGSVISTVTGLFTLNVQVDSIIKAERELGVMFYWISGSVPSWKSNLVQNKHCNLLNNWTIRWKQLILILELFALPYYPTIDPNRNQWFTRSSIRNKPTLYGKSKLELRQ